MRGKNYFLFFIILSAFTSLNAQPSLEIYNPDNLTNPEALFDHQLSGNVSVIGNQKKSFIIFDAKRMVETNKITFYFSSKLSIEQFKEKVFEKIVFLHSPDIVSWQKINEQNQFELSEKMPDIIQASISIPNTYLQYLKLSFDSVPSKTIAMTEVILESSVQKPLEMTSFKIKTDPDKRTSAELFVAFNRPVKCQVKYDSNYNYIYSKKLDNNLMNIYEEPTQRFIFSNLMPNTTYVYQITAESDGQQIEFPVHKFSTIKANNE